MTDWNNDDNLAELTASVQHDPKAVKALKALKDAEFN